MGRKWMVLKDSISFSGMWFKVVDKWVGSDKVESVLWTLLWKQMWKQYDCQGTSAHNKILNCKSAYVRHGQKKRLEERPTNSKERRTRKRVKKKT